MHTSDGCTLAGSNCQGNLGCPIKPAGSNNYGSDFNNANGGVYAMEWTSGSINIWFFPRGNIPSDILSSTPSPSGWGTATASFVGGDNCNIDQHFTNNNIIFDTTFCGDWAGGVWSQDGTCSALAGSCQDYVQNHPEAFAESYWTVNSLKVYQDNDNAPVVNIVSTQPFSSNATAPVVVPSTSSASAMPITTSLLTVQSASDTPSPVLPTYHQYTHTHGEAFESTETGLANLTIAIRDAKAKEPAAKDTLVEAAVSPPEKMSVEIRRVSRHLHRHVHHLHHS